MGVEEHLRQCWTACLARGLIRKWQRESSSPNKQRTHLRGPFGFLSRQERVSLPSAFGKTPFALMQGGSRLKCGHSLKQSSWIFRVKAGIKSP
jgi:hypothetical protein